MGVGADRPEGRRHSASLRRLTCRPLSDVSPTFVSAPRVTGVSATSGPAAGGTSLTITGTGFTGATSVDFGMTAAAIFTVNSDTSITTVSPIASAGAVDVTRHERRRHKCAEAASPPWAAVVPVEGDGQTPQGIEAGACHRTAVRKTESCDAVRHLHLLRARHDEEDEGPSSASGLAGADAVGIVTEEVTERSVAPTRPGDRRCRQCRRAGGD